MTDEFVEANRANWDARVSNHLLAYGAEAFADDPSANWVMSFGAEISSTAVGSVRD